MIICCFSELERPCNQVYTSEVETFTFDMLSVICLKFDCVCPCVCERCIDPPRALWYYEWFSNPELRGCVTSLWRHGRRTWSPLRPKRPHGGPPPIARPTEDPRATENVRFVVGRTSGKGGRSRKRPFLGPRVWVDDANLKIHIMGLGRRGGGVVNRYTLCTLLHTAHTRYPLS